MIRSDRDLAEVADLVLEDTNDIKATGRIEDRPRDWAPRIILDIPYVRVINDNLVLEPVCDSANEGCPACCLDRFGKKLCMCLVNAFHEEPIVGEWRWVQ